MPVSAIIPSFNGLSLLKKHLPKVIASLRKHDEVVIVDDASTDESVAYLTNTYGLHAVRAPLKDAFCFAGIHKDIDIKLLVNQANQRFASSCNRGVLSAKSEVILLVNNDVSPEANFLKYLLPHFRNKQVFAAGCKELAANEHNKEYGRNEAHFERGFLVHNRAKYQDEPETFWVSGGSGAFRRTMWEKLGGFDLDYQPAYWEDIDLSFRAKTRGWKVIFEPRAVVHHVHESTHKDVFGEKRMEVMAYKNQILFMWKNARGKELLEHFVWLPYHLVVTSCRSRGRFLHGFIEALGQLV